MFDGVSSKGKEVMVLMTSNQVDSLTKGMTRVGRIDSAIEIGVLDEAGVRRLISSVFTPEMLADDIDFDEGLGGHGRVTSPPSSWARSPATKSNAIIRTGSGKFKLTTEDFVIAAEGLRNQHDTHLRALDRPEQDPFNVAFNRQVEGVVGSALQKHQVDLEDGEIVLVDANA